VDTEPTELGSERFQSVEATVKRRRPRCVFVVESALAMKRLLIQNQRESSIETNNEIDTDLTVVRDFIKLLVDVMREQKAEFLLMFYNDLHEGPPPHEFTSLGNLYHKPAREVTYLPKGDQIRFVSADEMVQELEVEFLGSQTVAPDWRKSVEAAAHALNTAVPWDGSDGVVIWIGQSSQHFYVPPNEVQNIYHLGYGSPYDLSTEMNKLVNQGIHQMTFFITSDIPRPVIRESRDTWNMIAPFSWRFEVALANPSHIDASLTKAYEALTNKLNLKTIYLLQLPTRQSSVPYYRIPFSYLHPEVRIHISSEG